MTRTFVGGRFSKGHELLANEYVGFFALLSSGHGPLLGYIWYRLALIVSTRRQDYTYAPQKSLRKYFNKKNICLRPVSLCRCNSHNLTGPTAASLYLANDIVHSRGHCLGLRRRLRFARGSLRAVRSMRSFLAVLSKFIERTAMCSRGAGQYGRACLLTCPAKRRGPRRKQEDANIWM